MPESQPSYPQLSPCRAAAIGSLLGLPAGSVLAVVDAAVTLVPRLHGLPPDSWLLLFGSVAILAPAGAALGAFTGLLFGLIDRLSTTASRIARIALPILWFAALFAWWGNWGKFAGENRGYHIGVLTGLIALAAGIAGYALLRLFARRLAESRARASACVVVVLCSTLWIGSVCAVFTTRTEVDFPSSLPAPTTDRPNVLLIVLDTVRADHLSCYGYERKTSPQIDAFAAEARRFTNVLSPDCWTVPSHASFFTGLPTSAHGASWAHIALDYEFDTLAEQLQRAGYQTAGLSSNPVLRPGNGFGQGFDMYWNPSARDPSHLERLLDLAGMWPGLATGRTRDACSDATEMHSRLAHWFGHEYKPGRPFFVFLNYMEPHAPYVPPSHRLEWTAHKVFRKWAAHPQVGSIQRYAVSGRDALSAREISELKTLYDEEIAYVDAKVGDLLGFLRAAGIEDRTLIILTSDHGEHFGEHHLMEHQFSLYEPLVRVPLIVKYRDRFAAGPDSTLVQSHDVYPTILEIAGVPWKRLKAQTCRSLLHVGEETPRLAISEYPYPALGIVAKLQSQLGNRLDCSRLTRSLRAVQRGTLKLIAPSSGEPELYDLDVDGLESHDLAAAQPQIANDLEEGLRQWLQSFRHYRPAREREDGAKPEAD